jgi:glutamate N-acetyltransferase/amino-acid N-acetyltransferase
MLVVVTTDAVAGPPSRRGVARRDAHDVRPRRQRRCTSTNDTVLLLASGASGAVPAREALQEAVPAVCADLARQLVADAEGASKDVRLDVVNAATEDDAVEVGHAVARANLVKCAFHGEDPNWGRILSEIGMTSAVFEPERLGVAINGVQVCRDGATGEDRDLVDMSGREIVVTIDLGAGAAAATVWTNDLTAAYVHENSAYST